MTTTTLSPVAPADQAGDYLAQWAHREAQQEWVNRLAERHGPDVAERAIRALAVRDHRQYPQYRGHWNGWVAGVVTQEHRSKGGVQAAAGDVVLMHDDPYGWDRSFYSVRLGWNCASTWGIKPA